MRLACGFVRYDRSGGYVPNRWWRLDPQMIATAGNVPRSGFTSTIRKRVGAAASGQPMGCPSRRMIFSLNTRFHSVVPQNRFLDEEISEVADYTYNSSSRR
jgi:hypothetical protein